MSNIIKKQELTGCYGHYTAPQDVVVFYINEIFVVHGMIYSAWYQPKNEDELLNQLTQILEDDDED